MKNLRFAQRSKGCLRINVLHFGTDRIQSLKQQPEIMLGYSDCFLWGSRPGQGSPFETFIKKKVPVSFPQQLFRCFSYSDRSIRIHIKHKLLYETIGISNSIQGRTTSLLFQDRFANQVRLLPPHPFDIFR